ncbi:MAG TPA: hypothetical protein VJN02_03085 [Gammaproteobacteria bacterium]|nr:hypothetical protein [Gammaproteobacteria bacterium]
MWEEDFLSDLFFTPGLENRPDEDYNIYETREGDIYSKIWKIINPIDFTIRVSITKFDKCI